MGGSLLATLLSVKSMTGFVATTGGRECVLTYATTVVVG